MVMVTNESLIRQSDWIGSPIENLIDEPVVQCLLTNVNGHPTLRAQSAPELALAVQQPCWLPPATAANCPLPCGNRAAATPHHHQIMRFEAWTS